MLIGTQSPQDLTTCWIMEFGTLLYFAKWLLWTEDGIVTHKPDVERKP